MARPFLVASVDVEGSILVMMNARRVGFATVTSEFVSIRFRFSGGLHLYAAHCRLQR